MTKCPEEAKKTPVAFCLEKVLRNDIKAKYDLYNSPDASKVKYYFVLIYFYIYILFNNFIKNFIQLRKAQN